MTGGLFEYYIRCIWYPEIWRRTRENVGLIVDNCSAHGAALPTRNGLECIPLPPNVTSVYQTMDQGIIRALKANARADLLSQILGAIDHRDELRALGYQQKPGMRGLQYAHGAHVLDAIQILNRNIRKITAKTVVNCWIHSKKLAREQINKFYNSIGNPHPDFSTLENTLGLEAEFMALVGPYRSTVMNEMQGESDEEDDDLYNLRCFDGPSCNEEELMAKAESITGLFGSLNTDDNQNAESYLTNACVWHQRVARTVS